LTDLGSNVPCVAAAAAQPYHTDLELTRKEDLSDEVVQRKLLENRYASVDWRPMWPRRR